MWYSLVSHYNDGEVHKRTTWINDPCERNGEIMEVADFLAMINVENNGENKMLMIKAAKQRDIDSKSTDTNVIAIRHQFISTQSFALKDDITENVSISIPIYLAQNKINYMASI